MTEFNKYLLVLTTNKAVGNALAGIVGTDTGDAQTFDVSGIPCYPPGTTFTTEQRGPVSVPVASQEPAAWAVGVAVRRPAYDVAAAFAAGGYPQALLDAGLTTEQIDTYRSIVTVQAGDRSALEGALAQFVTSNGYELIPRV